MEIKQRYKMYKSGKNWAIAPLVFFGIALGFQAGVHNVFADETIQKPQVVNLNSPVGDKKENSTSTDSQEDTASDKDPIQTNGEEKVANQSQSEKTVTTDAGSNQKKASFEENDGQADDQQQLKGKDQLNDETINNNDQNNRTQSDNVNDKQQNNDQNNRTQSDNVNDKQQNNDQNNRTQSDNVNDKQQNNDQAAVDSQKDSNEALRNDLNKQQPSTRSLALKNDQPKQVKENGFWYLSDKNGHNLIGFQNIQDQNKRVYYNNRGQMQYGEQKISNNWYLFDNVTGAMQTGFKYLSKGNKTVYYNEQGKMQKGQAKVADNWYLFDNITGARQTGFKRIAQQNKTVYYNNVGQMQYGQQKIQNSWYLFDNTTGAMQTGFQKIANQHKTVYYANNGQMQYGQQQINNAWYLFDNTTGAMQTGFQKIANQHKTVYYANNGQMQYGQQQINNAWYLFDKITGAMQTGFQKIANQHKTVYYANNGQMQYGQQHLNGHWYLFDQKTGAMQTGFQFITSQNKLVYYDPTGKMQYGQQLIHGKRYDFNQKTGALKVLPGQNLIDGHWYLFDSHGTMQTGFQKIANQHKTVYYANNGQMQYGQQEINNHWYLFDATTGAMQTGLIELTKNQTPDGPKTVYYANNGQMQYGQQHLNGYWYLFDENSGAMQTGFKYISQQNKTVYYNSQGQMQYSWQKINNDQYYFDPVNGSMATGKVKIAGTTFDFSNEGKLESLMAFRNLLAQQINEKLNQKLDVNWQNTQDNYLAFSLHDVAQLVAQGDLNATNQAVEQNLLENDNLTGTVAVYTADITGGTVQIAADNGTTDFMDWYQDQLKDTNWQALGVGGIIDIANKNSWVAAYVLYRTGQDTANQTSSVTSKTSYEITATYKNAGVTNDVTEPLQAKQSVSSSDLNLTTIIPEKLLQGNSNSEFSQTDLENIYQTLSGSSSAIEGNKTYYDSQGNPYHYEFWLAGQSATDKENNFVSINTGKKYGDQLLIQLTATLVWGKPVSSDSTTTATGVQTSSMTADQIAAAYKNGTDTGLRYEGVTVKPIAGMTDDTIRGVDISSYIALQNAGVQFYDYNGKPADLVQVLHEAGVNYLRLRLWVDPLNAENQTYSGGASDEYNELQIAKEAAKYGMKVLLDFQYSDFWADPGKQVVPKAWEKENSAEIAESVYLYTRKTISDFKETGVEIGMVQIGNEITNGVLGIIASRDANESYTNIWNDNQKAGIISSYLNAGSKAVRELAPKAKVVIQLETPNIQKYSTIMTALKNNNVDYDVLGSSYYPFWSTNDNNGNGLGKGANTPNNLEAVEKMVRDNFGKEFVVLETGWTNSLQDADGTGNSIGSNQSSYAYENSPQGQVDELESMYQAIVNQNGLGAFYWEPAWIPVKAGWSNWSYNDEMSDLYGTGWASKYAVGYAPNNVMYYNGKPAWGGTTWDNVSLFDDLGYPLQSLNVYKGMLSGYQTPTTSTSNINLQIDSIYDNGVKLKNGNLKVGDVLATNDTNLSSGVSDSALTGKWESKIGTTQLNKIAAQLNGNSTAIIDSQTYYSTDGQAYHYEFWLSEGQSSEQKEWNFVNDNQNALYGSTLTAHVSASLVWGPAKQELS
ncbi:Arabinogalactan endo-1,4-beta-galactosidase precursor [Lactiplantibacillus plantarum]|uniref:glycosyl hydrolase 53 family protein n=1 Tax=Lactiplantibacillus plantarum TaxID=1590 RepID=UPI000CF89EF5|nr:glycosyl hydrolase 53 family protein [Lactiplantibacillus plantarum]SPE09065.1 Arabinogalactan endo-1,4-beta-galactosidase precursor [Lactiplantibacillus plantarum]SPE13650.1 Arabinogalactan endo-1,4-beta-galactosidase precursor [Lactiplantibacillus plantarum]